MPIYEYFCNSCGRNFEYLIIAKKYPEKCKFCNSLKIEQLMSVCGFFSKTDGHKNESGKMSSSSCGSCVSSNCNGCK